MMSSRLIFSILTQAIISVVAFSAQGEDLIAVSNLQTPPPNSSVFPGGGILAQPFKTGDAASLMGVQMYLCHLDPVAPSVSVSLYSDGNGHPGSSLASLGGFTVIDSVSYALYTFTSAVPIDLTAATTYWVVVNSITPGPYEFLWAGSDGAPYTGLPGWSMSERGAFGPGWSPAIGEGQLAVITSVPEPATVTFGCVAAAACMLVRWRKSSAGRR